MNILAERTMRDRIRSYAARAGERGFIAGEVVGYTIQYVSNHCWKLARRGELFPAHASPRKIRWFADREHAQAFEEAVKAAPPAPRKSRSNGIPSSKPAGKDPFKLLFMRKPAPILRAPWGPHDPAIVPAHVKVQVGPAYQPKFQALALVAPLLRGAAHQSGRVMHDPEAEEAERIIRRHA